MKKESISIPFRSPWVVGQLGIWGILLIGSFLVALFVRFPSFHSDYLPLSAYLVHALSLLGGGFLSGKIAGDKGWLIGGSQGVIYTLTLLMISFLAFDQMIKIHPLLMMICAFGLSSIGGILGEHTKR